MARSGRVRGGAWSHVGLAGPRPASPGCLYLQREGCRTLGGNSPLPVGSDLLYADVLRRALLALVS